MTPFSIYLQLKAIAAVCEEDRAIADLVCDHSKPNTYREPLWQDALEAGERVTRDLLDQAIANAAGIDQELRKQIEEARRILSLPANDLHARNHRRMSVGMAVDKALSSVKAMLAK